MNGIWYSCNGTQIEIIFYGKIIIRAKNKHLTYIIVDLTDTTKSVIVFVHMTRKYEMIYDPRHVNTSMPKETAKKMNECKFQNNKNFHFLLNIF